MKMRIDSISIENFRSFKNCKIQLNAYTSLVGQNGSGKSTIIEALNVFFGDTGGSTTDIKFLDIEDFHKRNTDQPIEITVTFTDLPEEAQEEFSGYLRQDKLIVMAQAVFDKNKNNAEVKHYGWRLGLEKFKPFFKAVGDKALAGELKREYQKIQELFSELPNAKNKPDMLEALSEYEKEHPEDCVPILSEDLFFGVSKGKNRFDRYIQWVYVPAVKDVTKENVEAKNTALGEILARTVRSQFQFTNEIKKIREATREKYSEVLKEHQGELSDVSELLNKALTRWAHPNARAHLKWTEDIGKSIRIDDPVAHMYASEGEFEGEITRFGHGLHRSYFLALVEVLSLVDSSDAPTLILGCEEPEIYQHPPQVRHLAGVLEKLSEGNAQILISTHSPYFVSGWSFDRLRMVRRDQATHQSYVASATSDEISNRFAEITGKPPKPPIVQDALLQSALQPQLSEMFFANKIVLVEGQEDVAYLTASLVVFGNWECFRRHGAHIVSVGGKSNLIHPLVVAEALSIPVFTIFDADADIDPDNKKCHRAKHEKDNVKLLKFLGYDSNEPFPAETVWGEKFVQWSNNFSATLQHDVKSDAWRSAGDKAAEHLEGYKSDFVKNPIYIGYQVKALYDEKNIPTSLSTLCQKIIEFVENS